MSVVGFYALSSSGQSIFQRGTVLYSAHAWVLWGENPSAAVLPLPGVT
ncbi:hypothetical protein BLL52_1939 [Rhodoferax antarcticus ANT.BR]|uniref:Uncharacterized protein n=1 Tax=Rhodoferax antarcticus ANT.BR TaxID=1111071 RepID=A0A1Q8YCH9_9BURK|nr:hypothetical protein BLL52_1939 [Rhodoferax antarcticus ANT.BR]